MDNYNVCLDKQPQRSQRIDYHLLNDGSDEEAVPEDRIAKRSRSDEGNSTVESVTADDTADQLIEHQHPLASQYYQSTEDGPSETSSLCESEPSGKRTQNQFLWAQFTSSPLPGKVWRTKRGKGLV
ncbi:hypothetical protein V1508DRAFT_435693 [Lipomyces doorenjongii]|uniref:uncharacterized protein n=1 Tax=Lipomyces doorenjongii TaxID=383834 RepID=UPI0034CF4184